MQKNVKQWIRVAGVAALTALAGCAHKGANVQHEVEKAATPDSARLVQALNDVFGNHQGMRGSHAKGFCASGEFLPSAHASQLTDSPMFKQASLPAEIRFSIGGGNPKASDKSRSIRGLSASFTHDDERYDLVLISEPAFFASTLPSFVSFLEARVPDATTKKPNPDKIKAHGERYPESKLQGALVAAHPAPASYVTTPYYSTHAFKFNHAHQSQYARIVVEPVKGKYYLTEEQEQHFPDNFLQEELTGRLAKAPAVFSVYAQLRGQGDSLINSATIWSEDRSRVELGKLVVKNVTEQFCDAQVFSPTNLPQGIEASDDPILKARAGAYAVSKVKRSQ